MLYGRAQTNSVILAYHKFLWARGNNNEIINKCDFKTLPSEWIGSQFTRGANIWKKKLYSAFIFNQGYFK